MSSGIGIGKKQCLIDRLVVRGESQYDNSSAVSLVIFLTDIRTSTGARPYAPIETSLDHEYFEQSNWPVSFVFSTRFQAVSLSQDSILNGGIGHLGHDSGLNDSGLCTRGAFAWHQQSH